MRHPHEGRVAELYRRDGERLVWVGYTAGPDFDDHPQRATWSPEIQGWVINEKGTSNDD